METREKRTADEMIETVKVLYATEESFRDNFSRDDCLTMIRNIIWDFTTLCGIEPTEDRLYYKNVIEYGIN